MNKKHRRNIKRLSKKFNISIEESINKFYNDQEIDKNVIYSISKNRNKGKVRKINSLIKKRKKQKQKELKLKLHID